MWRIIENLMSNVLKYSLQGSRVYIDITRNQTDGVLVIKNISATPLNIPVERLTERFVRGDEARTTEGSGLGLSIAQSLTTLQKGKFDIEIDGDLFKVIVQCRYGKLLLFHNTAAINGGSFLEGFADGALSGAISGAVTGAACAGLGALGALAGKSIQCMSTVGKAINVTSKVTAALSFGMDGFDMLAMGISLFDPSNALVEFNRKLHSNALYNGFQIAVNALAVFSAGAASTMKCFVAGTMILTVAGLVAIENIKAGDKVIATNPETFEVAEKTVLETYVRETTELLHLTINGEVIKTTFEHPFYVKDVGFVEAGKLLVGDKLVDSKGNVLVVEEKKLEITDEPVKVYNFKVDDFHTYHVGNNGILVHNADYNPVLNDKFKLTEAKKYERKINNSKNLHHDLGDFGEEVMKKVAKENNLGNDISAMFKRGRNGIDGTFLSEGPPPKLTIIESKASVKGKFNYSSKQKLGGEKYFKDMLRRSSKQYKNMAKNYKNLKKQFPELKVDYIRVEAKVKITKKRFSVEDVNVKAWGKI